MTETESLKKLYVGCRVQITKRMIHDVLRNLHFCKGTVIDIEEPVIGESGIVLKVRLDRRGSLTRRRKLYVICVFETDVQFLLE